MDAHPLDKIGEIVKAQTSALQHVSSLAQRGMMDLDRLTADADVLECADILRKGGSWEARSSAWQRLRHFGPTRRGWQLTLKDLLGDPDGWTRIFAAESLSMHECLPAEALPVLAATLSASVEAGAYDWATIASGAIWKYRTRPEEFDATIIDALIGALDVQNTDIQGYCAATLGCCGPRAKRAILSLAKISRYATHEKLRLTSLYALQQIDSTIGDSLDAFAVALQDEDVSIRGEAICEMAKFGRDSMKLLASLLSFVDDPDSNTRRFLAFAVGKIGDRCDAAVAVLGKLFQDSDASVCLAAAYAFLKLGVGRGVHHVYICDSLRHGDSFVRFLAAWALGEVGSFDLFLSLQVLNEAVQSESSDRIQSEIRAALDQLRRLGGSS